MSSTTNDTLNHSLSLTSGCDLRHVTSQPTLLAPSQISGSPSRHLSPLSSNPSRPGSRSPTSIPSSPTSIHSSSSAIFERDIETLSAASPIPHPATLHPSSNPHRTPRSKATEQIQQSVPSVLDEAASALAATACNDIAIIAPVPVPPSFSQTASLGNRSPPLHSRSPSPSPQSRKASLPPTSPSTSPSLNGAPVRSTVRTRPTSTGPLPPGPFGISSSTPTAFNASAPSPGPSPPTVPSALPPSLPAPESTASLHGTPAHQKRLSFVSYSDLLSSTPITSLPLSSLTSPHSSMPPPHLPAVSAATTISPPPSSAHSQGVPSRPLSTYSIGTSAGGGFSMSGSGGRGGGLGEEHQGVGKRLKDDIGGEWEREGFGKGLEERLEELMVGKA